MCNVFSVIFLVLSVAFCVLCADCACTRLGVCDAFVDNCDKHISQWLWYRQDGTGDRNAIVPS